MVGVFLWWQEFRVRIEVKDRVRVGMDQGYMC